MQGLLWRLDGRKHPAELRSYIRNLGRGDRFWVSHNHPLTMRAREVWGALEAVGGRRWAFDNVCAGGVGGAQGGRREGDGGTSLAPGTLLLLLSHGCRVRHSVVLYMEVL